MSVNSVSAIAFGPADAEDDMRHNRAARPDFESVVINGHAGRPIAIEVQRSTVNLGSASQRKAVVDYLFARLTDSGLTRAQIDASLNRDGALATAMRDGTGTVKVSTIAGDSLLAAPVTLPTVPANAGPVPMHHHKKVKLAPVPTEVVLDTMAMVSPLRALQYTTYVAARAQVVKALGTTLAQPTSVANAQTVRMLTRARNQLDVAASALRKGPIAASQVGDHAAQSQAAWTIYQAAYSLAFARSQHVKLSDFQLRSHWPAGVPLSSAAGAHAARMSAREALAETAAYAVFGLTAGDPLAAEYFSPQDDLAKALG